jgi:hypothetical protein
MNGTLTLSWGGWGGVYVSRKARRVCLGWTAITWWRVDIDYAMERYLELDRRAHEFSLATVQDDEAHRLRCLVAESLEVFATTFTLLTAEDDPRVELAANEVQQAHHRITAALSPAMTDLEAQDGA